MRIKGTASFVIQGWGKVFGGCFPWSFPDYFWEGGTEPRNTGEQFVFALSLKNIYKWGCTAISHLERK